MESPTEDWTSRKDRHGVLGASGKGGPELSAVIRLRRPLRIKRDLSGVLPVPSFEVKVMSRSDDAAWLRCQHTIRKLLHHLGKDALVYAQSALERETSEPERLRVFWENARKYFDEYEAKP